MITSQQRGMVNDMAEYYVVRDKNTGLYFRGKGVNRWGKHYNQSSIYRVRKTAEHTIKELSWRGEQAEVVPIQIIETSSEVAEVKHGRWIANKEGRHICSECGKPPLYRESGTTFARSFYKAKTEHCPHCGARMDGA